MNDELSDEEIAWQTGRLRWKLFGHQKAMYSLFRETEHRKVVWHCSRRIGKSYSLAAIGAEECIRKPGARVLYGAPTQKNVKEIVIPNIQDLLSDCPSWIRPVYRVQDGKFYFKHNGAELPLAGTDGQNADRMRGSKADLGILDEAGFMDNLPYVVNSILMPQFITTNGRLLLASSSPVSPGHPFAEFIHTAEMTGALVQVTILDDTRPEVKERIPEWMEEAGGAESTDWLREYMCKLIVDQSLAVVPEFTELVAAETVREVPRPECYDAYVAMDVGFNDLTAVLFGYWDFLNATLVIEDELVLNRMTTKELASGIDEKETKLWQTRPFLRVSDTDLIVINDLSRLHGLHFSATKKDDKEAAINQLRLMVKQRKLAIHPRCKNLILHLKYAVWNKQKTQFDRAAGFGHYDLIDALVYMVRSLRREKNPWPEHHAMASATHWLPPRNLGSGGSAARALASMVPLRRGR